MSSSTNCVAMAGSPARRFMGAGPSGHKGAHRADIARTLTFVGVRCHPDRWNDFRCRPPAFALVRGRIVHTAEVVSSSLAPPTLRALGSRLGRVACDRIHGADIANLILRGGRQIRAAGLSFNLTAETYAGTHGAKRGASAPTPVN